jgi:hypothetical protein
MAVRFVFNNREIDRIPVHPDVRNELRRRAEKVLAQAKATAPVATGEYRNGLHLEEMPDGSIRVAGSTDHDIYVEADTGNLLRSLDAAGGT